MINSVWMKEETILNKDNSDIETFREEKKYKRRDNAILNPCPSNSESLNKTLINNELMMFQQMCMNFGTPYSLPFATKYLNKIGINVNETDVKNMYLKEEITFISDYRENRETMLKKFLETCST